MGSRDTYQALGRFSNETQLWSPFIGLNLTEWSTLDDVLVCLGLSFSGRQVAFTKSNLGSSKVIVAKVTHTLDFNTLESVTFGIEVEKMQH